VDVGNALKSFITNKEDEISHMYTTLFVKFEVVNRTFSFVDTDDFSG